MRQAMVASEHAIPSRSRNELAPRCKRVLIADDDMAVLASLAAVFESDGYEVDVAQDGYQAVRRAAANPPDLVLLDLNMPRVDGWTVFAQMDRLCPQAPVIVITARPNQYQQAVRLGVDAFMEKPLDIPALLLAVQKLANEPAKRRGRQANGGQFVTWLLQPI